MYFDLRLEWPVAFAAATSLGGGSANKHKKGKHAAIGDQKSDALSAAEQVRSLTERQQADLQDLLCDAAELGYRTVALNVNVNTRYNSADHPCPFAGHIAPFPDIDPRTQSQHVRRNNDTLRITQLSRMTLLLDEESMGKHGHGITSTNQGALMEYDLLAAQPFNDVSFSTLCLSMTELKPISIDIISLDFSAHARPPFRMHASLVNTAIANGAVFEVCYSGMLANSTAGDKDMLKARRNIISATRDLLRITKGRNVILSSGASDVMGLRGPLDVVNLAAVIGMNPTAAKDAVFSTCRSLVLRAETRKTFRGVVSDVKVVLTQQSQDTALSNDKKRKVGNEGGEGKDDAGTDPQIHLQRTDIDRKKRRKAK